MHYIFSLLSTSTSLILLYLLSFLRKNKFKFKKRVFLFIYLCIYLLFEFLFLLGYYCCIVGTFWHLEKCMQYILVTLTLSIILLYTPLLLRIVSTGLIAPFLYISIYFHYICLPSHFTHILCLPIVTNPQTGPVLPYCSSFLKKKRHICLFEIAI
jgi:hypothetical protein